MQAQLHPKGKAAAGDSSTPILLLNEWIEIENLGNEPISLSCISVSHKFLDKSRKITPIRESYWKGGNSEEVLIPKQRLRIHSGYLKDYHLMNDGRTKTLSGFANRKHFAFNNQLGGTISLSWVNSFNVRQSIGFLYDADQLEGSIYRPLVDKLIPSTRNWLYHHLPAIKKTLRT